jgi:hypothetical protein
MVVFENVERSLGGEKEKHRSVTVAENEGHRSVTVAARFDRATRVGGADRLIEFEIFEPKNDDEVPPGTVTRAKATCLCCGTVLSPDRVRAQLAAQRGGADVIFSPPSHEGDGVVKGAGIQGVNRIGGARLLAVVTLTPGEKGRHYRLPAGCDYENVLKAQKRLQQILDDWEREGKVGL